MSITNCQSCNSQLSIEARFCQTCGTSVINEHDLKAPHEITAEWIKTQLEKKSYKVALDDNDPNLLFAKSENNPNITAWLRAGSHIIFHSRWTLKKPSIMKRKNFFETLNKGNSINAFSSCYADDKLTSITIKATFYITEKISSRDFLSFIEKFMASSEHIFRESGLSEKFA